MALQWFLHSVCQVLGHPNETNKQCHHVVGYPNEEHVGNGVMIKSSKFPKEGLSQVETPLDMYPSGFQMPLHYPRYTKADYEKMEEWKVDMLLREYGLRYNGTLEEKRAYAMGTFLWPDQY